jgi:hypothetical protein
LPDSAQTRTCSGWSTLPSSSSAWSGESAASAATFSATRGGGSRRIRSSIESTTSPIARMRRRRGRGEMIGGVAHLMISCPPTTTASSRLPHNSVTRFTLGAYSDSHHHGFLRLSVDPGHADRHASPMLCRRSGASCLIRPRVAAHDARHWRGCERSSPACPIWACGRSLLDNEGGGCSALGRMSWTQVAGLPDLARVWPLGSVLCDPTTLVAATLTGDPTSINRPLIIPMRE